MEKGGRGIEMITREKLNKVKLVEAEIKYGRKVPTQTGCIFFNICCEIGTEKGCKNCPNKKKRRW